MELYIGISYYIYQYHWSADRYNIIFLGIIALLSGSYFAPFSIIGLIIIIFGLITVLAGMFVRDPSVLGTIIGIWLIISGLLSLFSDKENSYIDIKI
ncbi:MAG: hypothetical protein E7Z85_04760 [Methanosphaera stadtmanae]|nr:hypothetical protein [Methanosphaera stadtmanae]